MRNILFLLCFNLVGCIEEENCYTTNIVDYYKTTTTEFYTISEPVYKVVCE